MTMTEFWSELDVHRAPFVHPADLDAIRQKSPAWLEPVTFTSLVEEGLDPLDAKRLHMSLLPVPYLGRLASADIFILMMNPGFAPGDYFAEEQPAWRDKLVANLEQRLDDDPFPHPGLDPRFAWTGAFIWWENKLRRLGLELVARGRVANYNEALSLLSRRVASLELVPYHSQNGFPTFVPRLPSAKECVRFVRDALAPKAAKGDVTLIATRQVRKWQLAEGPGVVLYPPSSARGASLSPKSLGGKAMLARLMAD